MCYRGAFHIGIYEYNYKHEVCIDYLMQGLSEIMAAERFALNGPNALTPPKQTPEIIKFMKQLFGGFALLLWLGSFLCFFAYTLEEVTSTAPKDYVRNTYVHIFQSLPHKAYAHREVKHNLFWPSICPYVYRWATYAHILYIHDKQTSRHLPNRNTTQFNDT